MNKNLKTSKEDPVLVEINIRELNNFKYRLDNVIPGQP
jgi:hypothetical protein